jgi:hypothetical protein
VEQNPAILDVVLPLLPMNIRNSLRAPNVHIIHKDPRRFLDRASAYDLILVGMPEPESGQANRFFTREFFRQCYSKLNAHGVIAFSLQSSENLWTPQLARRMVSIYRAAKSAFPEVCHSGVENVVIGSWTDWPKSLRSGRKAGNRAIPTVVPANYLRYVYTNDRFGRLPAHRIGDCARQYDVRLICYQYTLMIRFQFIPERSDLPYLNGTAAAKVMIIVLSPPALL